MKVSTLRSLVSQEIKNFNIPEEVISSETRSLEQFTNFVTTWMTKVLDYTDFENDIKSLTRQIISLITQRLIVSRNNETESTAEIKEKLDTEIFRKIQHRIDTLRRRNPRNNYPKRYLQIIGEITTAIGSFRGLQKNLQHDFNIFPELSIHCNNSVVELERLIADFNEVQLNISCSPGKGKSYLNANEKIKILVGLMQRIVDETARFNQSNQLIEDLSKIISEQAALENWTNHDIILFGDDYQIFSQANRARKIEQQTYEMIQGRLQEAEGNKAKNSYREIEYPKICIGAREKNEENKDHFEEAERDIAWENYEDKINAAWKETYASRPWKQEVNKFLSQLFGNKNVRWSLSKSQEFDHNPAVKKERTQIAKHGKATLKQWPKKGVLKKSKEAPPESTIPQPLPPIIRF